MRIRVETGLHAAGELVCERLRAAGHEATLQLADSKAFELGYRRDLPLATVTALLGAIEPLSPSIKPLTALPDGDACDAVLSLGDTQELGHWDVDIHVDERGFSERVGAALRGLGLRIDDTDVEEISNDELRYGGATPFARQMVRLALDGLGVRGVREVKAWGDGDNDIWLYLRDPSLLGLPLRERLGVEIVSDDLEDAEALATLLRGRGFTKTRSASLPTVGRARFAVEVGGFDADGETRDALVSLVELHLADREADPAAYPVRVTDERGRLTDARIELPIRALRESRLRPWAGEARERWDIEVRTDTPAAGARAAALLQEAGFEEIRVSSVSAGLIDVTIRHDDEGATVAAELAELLEGAAFSSEPPRRLLAEVPADTVVIDLPADDGRSRETRVHEAAAAWRCSLRCPDPAAFEGLQHDLRAIPWSNFETETEEVDDAEIQYGGAPPALVAVVADLVHARTGRRLVTRKAWGDDDHDIWIRLDGGSSSGGEHATDEETHLDLHGWLADADEDDEDAATVALLDVGASLLRIAEITLPRRADLLPDERALVPEAAPFAGWCLDGGTAETLAHVAESVALAEPCLLEGETSVSKTSVIQYLAMLLGQPVVRLNLNGQTDTGELVGRFVPRDDPPREGEPAHPWRWQDGLIVQAMRRGWWVVLDELNLAEPQILERLNPVLERYPSLVLTEHRGEVIGSGGDPISPHFRIFATMNPAEYAGRSALSPAYRDRWRGYRYVRAPGEGEYLAMLRFLVFGEQPDVRVLGRSYLGTLGEAPLAALAELEGIEAFLRALARFQSGIEHAASSRDSALGNRRKERYVFTRRGLLALMEYLALHANLGAGSVRALRRALLRYFVARVHPGADQALVARLLDAAGIGPGVWDPDALDAALHEDPDDDDDDDADDEGDSDDWVDDDEDDGDDIPF